MASPVDVPIVLVDSSLRAMAVTASTAIPSGSSAYIFAGVGTDGIVRYANLDSSNALRITGSVGVGGPLNVLGTVTANVTGTVNLDRGNSVASPLFVSGALSVTPSGVQQVTGTVGLATASIPVVVLSHPQFSGSVNVTNTLLSVTGSAAIFGQDSSGSAITANPVVVAGRDAVSGTVRIANYDEQGSAYVRTRTDTTFAIVASDVSPSTNKHMLSIFNTTLSLYEVHVYEVRIQNAQTEAIEGDVSTFDLKESISSTGFGSSISSNVFPLNIAASLPSTVQLTTGGAITTNRTLARCRLSNAEWTSYGGGSFAEHTNQNLIPTWRAPDGRTTPVILPPGFGLTVQHVSTTTSGSFDLSMLFTVVRR